MPAVVGHAAVARLDPGTVALRAPVVASGGEAQRGHAPRPRRSSYYRFCPRSLNQIQATLPRTIRINHTPQRSTKGSQQRISQSRMFLDAQINKPLPVSHRVLTVKEVSWLLYWLRRDRYASNQEQGEKDRKIFANHVSSPRAFLAA